MEEQIYEALSASLQTNVELLALMVAFLLVLGTVVFMVALFILVIVACVIAAIGVGSAIYDYYVFPRLVNRADRQTWPEYRRGHRRPRLDRPRLDRPSAPASAARRGMPPQDHEFRYNVRPRTEIPADRVLRHKPGRNSQGRRPSRSSNRNRTRSQRKRVKKE